MAHALLVADQSPELISVASPTSDDYESLQKTIGFQQEAQRPLVGILEFSMRDAFQSGRGQAYMSSIGIVSTRAIQVSRNRRGLSARHALEQIAGRRKAQKEQLEFRSEIEWIAANSKYYPDRWIALLGTDVLAEGASAREVFEATRGTSPTPLIVHIEPDTILPFAGW